MISGLQENRDFKQMCVYNLKRIVEGVCPPNTDWEKNMLIFYEQGGIKTIAHILKKHSGDGEILEDCTKVLSQLPKHSRMGKIMCRKLVTDNAVIDTLEYLKKSPGLKGGLENAMSMVQMCSEINPEAMGNAANIDAIFDVGKMFDGNACVVSAVAASNKALCLNRKAAKVFVEEQGLEKVTARLNCKASSAPSSLAQLYALNKLVGYGKANIQRLQDVNGLKRVVAVLDVYHEEARQKI